MEVSIPTSNSQVSTVSILGIGIVPIPNWCTTLPVCSFSFHHGNDTGWDFLVIISTSLEQDISCQEMIGKG